MKKIVKSFWGCVPFAVFLLCISLVATAQAVPDNTLRILPRNILICFGVGSFGILFLWGNMKFGTFCRKTDKTVLRSISVLAKVLSVFGFVALVFASIFVMGFSHRPEHIVTRNGIKMVASVNSFLDEQVYYYQYKSWFFYGKQLGYEYYGSGGNDPLAQTPERTPVEWHFYDLEGNLIESSAHEETAQSEKNQWPEPRILAIEAQKNEKNEAVFSISADDFVSSYNSIYRQEHTADYLTMSTEWTKFIDRTPCDKYEADCYRFSEEEQIWSMPTISIYTPENDNSSIYEIELTFDDHGYQEQFYRKFEEICFYSLKVVLPEMHDSEINTLYKNLYSSTNYNFFGDYYTYDGVEKPTLSMVYYYGAVGFYGYYGAGTDNICIIPVTENVINTFLQKGVIVKNLAE